MLDKESITYKELTNFYESIIPEFTWDDKADLYIDYQNQKEIKKIKDYILTKIPTVFEGQNIRINFIDDERKMAVIIVCKNEKILSYFAYLADYGIVGNVDSYDKALLACICKKYNAKSTFLAGPYVWAEKMLGLDKNEITTESTHNKRKE